MKLDIYGILNSKQKIIKSKKERELKEIFLEGGCVVRVVHFRTLFSG